MLYHFENATITYSMHMYGVKSMQMYTFTECPCLFAVHIKIIKECSRKIQFQKV